MNTATVPKKTPPKTSTPTTKSRQSHRRPQMLVNYGLVAIVLIAYLFPLVYLLNTALKSTSDFYADPVGLATDPQFSNFADAWVQGNFASYVLNSVLYTVCAASLGTAISLVIGFPVARGYVRHTRLWNGLFVALLFLPNSLMTIFQLMLRIGLYDTQLGYILIVGTSVGVGPILISAYVRSIPFELDEAAAADGCGYWRYLVTFVIPLAKPALATVFILQAIGVWNDIILATILLPDPAKSPISLGLYAFQGTYTSQWGLLGAATLIVAAPLIAAYVFLQRFLIGGVVGSVKG